MIFTIQSIVLILIGLSTGYLMDKIMSTFLTMRNTHFLMRLIAILAFFLTGNLAIIFPGELTGTAAALCLFLITVLILYKDPLLVKLSAIAIIYPITVSIAYMTEDIGFSIWYHFFHTNMSAAAEGILTMLSRSLRIPLWYFVYCFTKNWITQISRQLTLRMWLVIDAISLTSCVGIVTVIYNSDIISSYAAYPACISCILTGVGTCYLCSYISRTFKADMEIQTLKYQQSYYRELEENQKTVRKLRHDMKNHLNIIGTFLRDDNLIQAKEYFSDLTAEFSTGTRTFCTNSIVNAVINAKYDLAVRENINCTIQVDIPDEVELDDISLCSLFANTLDNAIEACCKMEPDKQRWILLKARDHNGHFSYEISNSKVNEVIYRQKKIMTDKKEKSVHGIGLKTVSEIIAGRDGHLQISHTDQDFTLTAII